MVVVSTFINIMVNSSLVFAVLTVLSGILVLLGKVISDESFDEHVEN